MKVCATFPRGRSYCWFCRTFVVPHTLGNGFTAVTAVVWSVRVYGRATILLCGTAKKCWLSNFRSVGTLFHRYRWSSFLYFVRPYDQAKTKPLPQHQPPRWANVVVIGVMKVICVLKVIVAMNCEHKHVSMSFNISFQRSSVLTTEHIYTT